MDAATYREFTVVITVPFPVIKVNDHTLTINENGIHNTVSSLQATLAHAQDFASSASDIPFSN